MTGYNYFADDEEDYVVPAAETAGEQASNVPQKSALIEVHIGADNLPTQVDFSRAWKSSYDPREYGESIMQAYRYSLYERTLRISESGTRPTPSIPPLREIAPSLLQTRTYDEYNQLFGKLIGQEKYTAHGPGLNDYDESTLIVEADRTGLTAITLDGDWAARTEPFTIAQDIVNCSDAIRAMKPRLRTDMYLDQESDTELMARIVRHERQLLENEI